VVIPARVTIGPHRYKVGVAKPSGLTHEEYGVTDLGRTTITLAPGMSASQQRATFLHECLHAMLSLTGWDHRLGSKKEEQLVRALEPVLLGFLADNREVVRWLSK
jgi:hypothetical protein